MWPVQSVPVSSPARRPLFRDAPRPVPAPLQALEPPADRLAVLGLDRLHRLALRRVQAEPRDDFGVAERQRPHHLAVDLPQCSAFSGVSARFNPASAASAWRL